MTYGGLRGTVRGRDLAVLAGFALLAWAYALGRGAWFHPFLFLDADAAKLTSWAAALDHPERFAGDSSLGDTADFRYYFTVHLPLLRFLTKFTGHYADSFSALLWPHLVVQLSAFYTLGRVLFRDRFFAVMLALVTFPPVNLILWEVWGVLPDAVPRIGFQALLPFVLAVALSSLDRPGRWPAVLGAVGLLMYVHPVSTPAWALAVWAGLWLCHPASWGVGRRFAVMFGLGIVFLTVAGPFLWIYLTQHEHGISAEIPVAKIREIFSALLPPEYFDAGYAFREFAGLWANPKGLLWACAGLGAAGVWRLRPQDRLAVKVVGCWAVAIAFVSFAVPYVEQTIEAALGSAPVDILLTRNVRYLIPLALLFGLWGLASLAGALPARRSIARAVAAGLVALWWAVHFPPPLSNLAACVRLGSLTCAPASWPVAAEAIEAIRRETPEGARILPSRFAHSVPIRFHAMRPVIHSRWDPAVLMMGNHRKLLAWYDTHREQQRIRALPKPERAAAHLRLAARLGAEFVLLDSLYLAKPFPLEQGTAPDHRLVWRNADFALLELRGRQTAEPRAP